MTVEEKKHYLSAYRLLDSEIQQKMDELAHWRARSTQITPILTGMPKSSKVSSRVESTVIKIVQLANEVNADIDRLVWLRNGIKQQIDRMENDTYRFLLECRYIGCMTWEAIAEVMNYSWQHMHKLHRRALEEFCVDEESWLAYLSCFRQGMSREASATQ